MQETRFLQGLGGKAAPVIAALLLISATNLRADGDSLETGLLNLVSDISQIDLSGPRDLLRSGAPPDGTVPLTREALEASLFRPAPAAPQQQQYQRTAPETASAGGGALDFLRGLTTGLNDGAAFASALKKGDVQGTLNAAQQALADAQHPGAPGSGTPGAFVAPQGGGTYVGPGAQVVHRLLGLPGVSPYIRSWNPPAPRLPRAMDQRSDLLRAAIIDAWGAEAEARAGRPAPASQMAQVMYQNLKSAYQLRSINMAPSSGGYLVSDSDLGWMVANFR